MQVLSQQFTAFIDEATLLNEWNLFKFDSTAVHAAKFRKSPWSFYQHYATTYPELWKLVKLLLILPVNSAACERGFSQMKIVKTDLRNRLSTEQLNNLMSISLSGSLGLDENLLISKAVNMWHTQRKRRISTSSVSGEASD